MTDIAIRVKDLSKQYHIGGPQARYKTIRALWNRPPLQSLSWNMTHSIGRESLIQAVALPFRRLSSVVRGQSSAVSNETIWALKDVSFEVKRGEAASRAEGRGGGYPFGRVHTEPVEVLRTRIGRNGAGKTTLLKILSRITEPTEGCAETAS